MAESSRSTTTKPRIAEFTVEFGDDMCRQIHIQTFQRTVRGSWSNLKLLRSGGGRNLGDIGQQLPDIPGLQCKLSFTRKEAVFFDPAKPDDEVWSQLNRALQTSPNAVVGVGQEFGPVATVKEPLDDHTLKTFARELVRFVEGGKAVVVKGTLPSVEQIDKLDGRYLFDPAWHSQWKPRFEDEYSAWKDRALDRT